MRSKLSFIHPSFLLLPCFYPVYPVYPVNYALNESLLFFRQHDRRLFDGAYALEEGADAGVLFGGDGRCA
jgi:hypothetical protein